LQRIIRKEYFDAKTWHRQKGCIYEKKRRNYSFEVPDRKVQAIKERRNMPTVEKQIEQAHRL
jgi:hypothetical protein